MFIKHLRCIIVLMKQYVLMISLRVTITDRIEENAVW